MMIFLTLFLWLICICDLNAQVPRQSWPRIRPMHSYVWTSPEEPENFDLSPKYTVVAPEQLRVGNKENILVEALNLVQPVTVSFTVYDFPDKSIILWKDNVVLNAANSYSVLHSIEVNPSLLHPDEKMTKHVQLVTQFGQVHRNEQILKVSFLSGYIFIQTDKPIYNPGDKVRFRAFVSNIEFQAFNSTISVEIQNPEGITVHASARSRAPNGIFSDTYALSEMVTEGKWTIVAKFDHWKENTFNTEFEVKKYVLPAFNVTLTPMKHHLNLDDQELAVKVTARYLYDEPVEGVAYVVFGVERNGNKIRLPNMKQVKDLKVSHHDGSPALNVPVKINFLASPVMVQSGTAKVSFNMPSTHDFSLSQIIMAETEVPGLKDQQQAKANLMVYRYSPSNMLRQNYLYVSLSDSSVKVGDVLNMKLHLSVFSQKERNFIKHVSYVVLNKGRIIQAGKVNVAGQDITNFALPITSKFLPTFRFLVYFVLPWSLKGEVVADSVMVEVEGNCVGSLTIGPKKGEELETYSPGSRFSFQIRGDPGAKVSLVAVDNAVFLLSKSRLTQSKIWDTVGRSDMGCSSGGGMNPMHIFKMSGLTFGSSYGESTDLDGAPTCHLQTQTRRRRSAARLNLRAELEKKYSEELLQRCCMAGMKEIPMPYSCHRRSLYITEDWNCVVAFLECCSQYWGEVLGVITPPPPTIPEPLPTQPAEVHERLPVIRYAQREVLRGEPGIPGPPGLPGLSAHHPRVFSGAGSLDRIIAGRVGDFESVLFSPRRPVVPKEEEDDEDEYASVDDIYVRNKFYESWLWTDITLPAVPKPGDKDGLATVSHALPDSITQWGILGISASHDTGFCVAEPFNVKSWKPFFIDLRLPRTAARNEHLEIKAVLHNYIDQDQEVLVILKKTEDMCSVAFNEDHKQQVMVRARSSVLLRYTVVPLKAGELPLQVTALARFLSGQDAVRKNLRVVVEGIQKMDVRSYVLDPADKGDSDGSQHIRVGKLQLISVVPNSNPETFVNVRGDLLADSIDNSINKDSLASLIKMPGGCVEQNLASITLPLLAAHYLDHSNQWESVGIARREEAIRYIKQGYENQLHYRKKDNSYPPYRNEGTSTWITSFVVKVFSMAKPLISVDEQHICGPLLYLLRHKQMHFGSFKEDNPVYTTSMTGGLQGAESRETLTAFVLIALAEAQNAVTCNDLSVTPQTGLSKAGVYLQEHFPRLRRPYSVAIACYALALSGHGCMKSMLLRAASSDRTHWPDENPFFSLEATGYALLALLQGGHMLEATPVFKWLNEQRRVGGGYGSTQSTVIVLQALSQYLVKRSPRAELNLKVELRVPERSDTRWAFTSRLAHVARSSRVPLDQDFTVVASGNGQGILEVVTVYNELPDVYEKSTCNGFELDVSVSESSEKPPPDVEKSYSLNISVKALEPRQVRMAILDISLPTGFEPETSDLELLTNSVDRYINNFQVVDNLSDRGNLIIHLFKVSNREPDIITFRLQQKFRVGLLQPSTVTVYQYYNKDKRCSRFYTPPEDKEQLSQICKDNICRCTQGDCSVMKTEDQSFSVSERINAVCNGIHHALKVRVLNISISQYDRYELEILQVIKEGNEFGLKRQDTRVFLSHAGCRTGLNLQEGQDYLIFGPSSDVWSTGSTSSGHMYILGKRTWVEGWPSSADCVKHPALQKKCQELETFANDLMNFGCQT